VPLRDEISSGEDIETKLMRLELQVEGLREAILRLARETENLGQEQLAALRQEHLDLSNEGAVARFRLASSEPFLAL
jgi:hypothetical protein